MSSEYHLAELRIALDEKSPEHVLPPVPANCSAVLDLGCGAGQTLIALDLPPHVLACGMDPDASALQLGRTLTQHVNFLEGKGEVLPFADETFDLVFSRVALPYMHIPSALQEIARVLKPGGMAWLSLHPPRFALRWGLNAIKVRSLRRLVHLVYVVANGMLLNFVSFQPAWPGKKRTYESVQTKRGIRRALHHAGFKVADLSDGRFFIVTAFKK
jgi:SAM-dependent methyltransferase